MTQNNRSYVRWFVVRVTGEVNIWTTSKQSAIKEAKAAFAERTLGPEDLTFKATEVGKTMPKQ
jgi:hypothetical protein